MSDRITIDPGAVRNAGAAIDAEAGEATAALTALFDSAHPAAEGNVGFATGAKLIAFADDLRSELDATISELSTTAHKIANGATQLERTDADTAEGISRIATALSGLGNDPLAG
ncbi:type VII secretion target [Gordonia sp. DT218]|uniref:type VII secretion target n=1 Tax=unclassified Gordonia (in: high G+C Gram-positive bacteria) TaxID=2657482 RepID=UPI003CE93347